MLITFKTHKHIYDVTNMIILFNVFFWIKLLLKLPNILTPATTRRFTGEQVDILFLSETKLDEKRMKAIKQKLQMGNMTVVDVVGKGGKLLCCGGEELM